MRTSKYSMVVLNPIWPTKFKNNLHKSIYRHRSALKPSLRSQARGRQEAKFSSWLQTTCAKHQLVNTDAFEGNALLFQRKIEFNERGKNSFFCFSVSFKTLHKALSFTWRTCSTWLVSTRSKMLFYSENVKVILSPIDSCKQKAPYEESAVQFNTSGKIEHSWFRQWRHGNTKATLVARECTFTCQTLRIYFGGGWNISSRLTFILISLPRVI